jgi:hypothetical protein
VKLENEELTDILSNEVLKRDTLDGDKAVQAKRLVNRSNAKQAKTSKSSESVDSQEKNVEAPGKIPATATEDGSTSPNQ